MAKMAAISSIASSQESLHKMAASLEAPAVIDVKQQSSAITDATPVFPVLVKVTFEDIQGFHRHLRLVSCVADPPLVSARAVDIPRASALVIIKAVPLSSVLPVMAVTILCVWVTHCSSTPQSSLQPMSPLQSPLLLRWRHPLQTLQRCS